MLLKIKNTLSHIKHKILCNKINNILFRELEYYSVINSDFYVSFDLLISTFNKRDIFEIKLIKMPLFRKAKSKDLYFESSQISNHFFYFGSTGKGKTNLIKDFYIDEYIFQKGLKNFHKYELHRSSNIDVYLFFNKDNKEYTLLFLSNNFLYSGEFIFNKNGIISHNNSMNHSINNFKDNIAYILFYSPRYEHFKELMNNEIPFEEKHMLYQMMEI